MLNKENVSRETIIEENNKLKKTIDDIEKYIMSQQKHYQGMLIKSIRLIKKINGIE